MNAEQFFNNGFGADVEKVHRKHVIELMTNFAKYCHTEQCNIHDVGGSLEDIYLFKVRDFTTILLGRYDKEKKCYYIQRGDGTKYEYDEYRIVWRQQLFLQYGN